MSTLDKWLMATLGLVALYLIISPQSQVGQTFKDISSGYSDVLKTLQARSA